jgi:hypothetical protein
MKGEALIEDNKTNITRWKGVLGRKEANADEDDANDERTQWNEAQDARSKP